MDVLIKIAQIIDPGPIPQVDADGSDIQTILQIVFTITGALSVLIISIAGFTYTRSAGEPGKTAKAKDTIIYAIVGLLVSIFAVTIVSFVIGRTTT